MERIGVLAADPDEDFVRWLEGQVTLLRAHRFHLLDLENLVEELESIVRNHRRELGSRLNVIIMHLLKWTHQPQRRSSSWRNTLDVQRQEIARLLQASPSLSHLLHKLVLEEYPRAVRLAARQTGLAKENFPPEPPFTLDELLDEDFLP